MRCLRALFACRLPPGVQIHVLLVDDGSTDGTRDIVRTTYPDVEVLRGDGNLYWNGGMRKAFAAAMERNFDYYLWLNDDTYLYPETVRTLLDVAAEAGRRENITAVVVGSTQATSGGPVTYGGLRKTKPSLLELVVPQKSPVRCDTLTGNCVLVPDRVAKQVGNLDALFIHAIGDVDYGLRVDKAGFSIFVMPGYAGICEPNPVAGTPKDASLPLNLRFQLLLGPKGLPFKLWLIFLWRHFGILGLAYWVWTYAKLPVTWLLARLKSA